MPFQGRTPLGHNPYRGQQDTRPCAHCGAPITRYLNPDLIDRPWTCSKRCRMLVKLPADIAQGHFVRPVKKRRGDTVPCTVCGTQFYRPPSSVARNRETCSVPCGNQAQRKQQIIKDCAHCGAPMTLPPSAVDRQYCSKRCNALGKTRNGIGRFHNGRPVLMDAFGYLTLYEPGHPCANRSGRVLEHRYVMCNVLGRPLLPSEHIDHINQDKTDNRPENLQVMTPSDHARKTSVDQRRARAKILADLAAYEAKYGPLE